VFRSMDVNENKRYEEIAGRRLALFGDPRARVKLEDIFDVEAPASGNVRWNISALKAYQFALFSEREAVAFCHEALDCVDPPGVKALSEELQDEEVEHLGMLVKVIAKLPPSAEIELEDQDTTRTDPP